MIKFYGANVLYNVIDRAIQVHGALGFSTDMPLERMYRAARSARLVDGADEVHKVTVARAHAQGLRAGRGADRASADAAEDGAARSSPSISTRWRSTPDGRAGRGRREARPPVVANIAGMAVVFALVLFLPAGTLAWPAGWTFYAAVLRVRRRAELLAAAVQSRSAGRADDRRRPEGPEDVGQGDPRAGGSGLLRLARSDGARRGALPLVAPTDLAPGVGEPAPARAPSGSSI